MDGQLSFASLDFAGKKKRTKRDVFLAEMAAAVPWSALEAIIEPHYPKVGPQGGRRPFPIAVMLRIIACSNGTAYRILVPRRRSTTSNRCAPSAILNSAATRSPMETTILNFRHLLETHALTQAVFVAVAEHLEARGALLRGGTIVDATLTAGLALYQERGGPRDPEMRSSTAGSPMVVPAQASSSASSNRPGPAGTT